MLDLFLTPEMAPFAVSLGLLLGLFVLELVFLLLGGSLITSEAPDADLSLPDAPDLEDFDLPELSADGVDLAEYDIADLGDVSTEVEAVAPGSAGPLGWLGIGKAPFIVWLATFLLAFGLSGAALQIAALRGFGALMPALGAGVLALPAGALFARTFAAGFARLVPQSESTALSERSLGRRRGVVSQGTAKQGNPAQVRVLDGHGNFHYLRAEPLEKDAEIAQGTEVLVLRNLRDGGYRILPLS